MTESIRLGFVCVQNAGRSQMATAFAQRERDKRGLEDRVEIVTGGTHPADEIHDIVVQAMNEVGIALSDRSPQEVTADDLDTCDLVATMGCSTLELDADVDVRDWALDDPHGVDFDVAEEIRDEVETKVRSLFDEVEEHHL